MNIKHALVPLVASGGLAAALFGGGAVSTAWSTQSSGSFSATAATVGSTLTGGNITFTGPGGTPLLPGDTQQSTVTFTNTGNTPSQDVLAFGSISPAMAPLANDITVSDSDNNFSGTLASIAGTSHSFGPLPANTSVSDVITMTLSNAASQTSDAGTSVSMPYTVTATATH